MSMTKIVKLNLLFVHWIFCTKAAYNRLRGDFELASVHTLTRVTSKV